MQPPTTSLRCVAGAVVLLILGLSAACVAQQQPQPQPPPPPDVIANSYIRVSVGAPVLPATGQNDPAWGDVTVQNTGGEDMLQDDGAFLTSPTASGNAMLRIDYSATQAGTIVTFGDPAAGTALSTSVQKTLIEGVWQENTTSIIVRQRIRIIRDIAMYEYEIENGDTANPHAVEFRLMIDTHRGAADDGPVYISGVGKVETETEFLGANVPAQYLVMDDETNITVTAQGIFSGPTVTTPDRLVVAYAPDIRGVFDYTITPTKSITTDSCFACYWNQKTLNPGEKVTYRIYYGNGLATHYTESNVDVALVAPFSLQLSADGTSYSNSPFQVTAALTNLTGTDLLGGSAVLNPDRGLALEGVDPTLQFPAIPNETTQQVTWLVRATGERTGHLGLNVRVGAMGLTRASLYRTVNVPALVTMSVSANLGRGLRFISFPFDFLNPDPRQALSITDANGIDNFPELIAVYDPEKPETNAYDVYPYGLAAELVPGRAYWFYVDSDRTITAIGGFDNIRFLNTEPMLVVDLKQGRNGWNGIGCPFSYGVQLGETQFVYNGTVLSYADAVRAGWVRGAIWYWDPTLNGNQGGYAFTGQASSYLAPWTGYWIKILVDCDLIFQPGTVFGAPPPVGTLGLGAVPDSEASAAKARGAGASARDWLLELGVSAGEWSDFGNYIGVSPQARDGYDPLDVEKPPLPSPVSLAMRPARGAAAEALMQDVRAAAGGEKTWDVLVRAELADEEVTVSWPTIRYLPRELEAVLEDLDAGRTVFMRAAPSYTFNSGSGGVRHLRITVGPRKRGLQLAAVSAQPLARGRGATLAYTLSAPATVDVVVLNAAGRKVRTVARGLARPAGAHSAVWDGRTDAGTMAPAGLYRVEVTARSEAGGRVAAFATVVLR